VRLQRVKEVTNFQLARFPKRKKRYEKSEILEQRELAKTLTRVDVFDWILSRRVFDSRREREWRHDLLKADVLRKESNDDDANTNIRAMRGILSSKNKEDDDDELNAKRRRAEVERLVREKLERKRESGKVKVLE